MPRTIVERIMAEQCARRAAQEAVLGAVDSTREAPRPVSVAGEGLLSSFAREVIPVIGLAVASEMSSSLDKVRLELVACLEQALARGAPAAPSAPAAPAAPYRLSLVEELDNSDTDLDMPAEDVVREIDRVLSEFGPVETQQILWPEALPASGATVLEAPPSPFLISQTETTSELPGEAAAAEVDGSDTRDLEISAEEAGVETEALPLSPMLDEAEPSPPPPAQLPRSLEEALAPGIAEGISQFAEDVEKGQERIVEAIRQLQDQVSGLEAELRSRMPADRREETRELWTSAVQEAPTASPQEFQARIFEILSKMEERIAEKVDAISSLLMQDQHS
jgi:hypothetical protein